MLLHFQNYSSCSAMNKWSELIYFCLLHTESMWMIEVDSGPHKMQIGNSLSGLLMRRPTWCVKTGDMLEYQCVGRQLESHYLEGKKIQNQHLGFLYLRKIWRNSELSWTRYYNMNYLVVLVLGLILAWSLSKWRLLGLRQGFVWVENIVLL